MIKLVKFIFWVLASTVLAFAVLALYILCDWTSEPRVNTAIKNQVNDVTQLTPVNVATIVAPRSSKEIADAIIHSDGLISIGGGKNSQGGQTAYENSLHLDMTQLNNVIEFNPADMEITVQAGMRWRDLQSVIDPYNLSIKIMQSYANFTVGGSLSVNVHGRYMGEGPIIRSVKAFKIILASGEEVSV